MTKKTSKIYLFSKISTHNLRCSCFVFSLCLIKSNKFLKIKQKISKSGLKQDNDQLTQPY